MRRPYLAVSRTHANGSRTFLPHLGGYGPWRIRSVPWLRGERLYLCTPMHMTRDDLRAQYAWAMQRSDRRPYLPSKRFAPRDTA